MHHWIWLYWDLFSEQIKNICWAQWSWFTDSCVSMTTISYWTITWGDVTVSDVTKMPTVRHKNKIKMAFIHLGTWTSVSSNPSVNTDIRCLINRTRWKNTILVHFIHSVSFTCTWVPAYRTSAKDTKKRARSWRGGDMTDRLVKYSSKFIPPSDPPLSCCQHHLQIMTSEFTDTQYTVYTGWF